MPSKMIFNSFEICPPTTSSPERMRCEEEGDKPPGNFLKPCWSVGMMVHARSENNKMLHTCYFAVFVHTDDQVQLGRYGGAYGTVLTDIVYSVETFGGNNYKALSNYS